MGSFSMLGSDKVLATFSSFTSYHATTKATLPSSVAPASHITVTIHLPIKTEEHLIPFRASFLYLEGQSGLAFPLTRSDPGPAALPVMD